MQLSGVSMRYLTLLILIVLTTTLVSAIDVTNCAELQAINNNKLGDYTLLNDIDCSGVNFVPIGNNDWENQFKGSIDGNGHVIKNLNINTPSSSYVGFVGYLFDGASIINLGIENATISGSMHTGVMAGYSAGIINNSYVTGTTTTTSWNQIGGFSGSLSASGRIYNSYAQVDVTGNDNVGGFVAQNDGTIYNSYSSGDITANAWASNVGGFIGLGSGSDYGNYWDKDVSGITDNYGNAVGKTTTQMKQQATFVGWDFSNIWSVEEGVLYPYLQSFGSVVIPNDTSEYDAHLNYYIEHQPDGTFRIVVGEGVTYLEGDTYIPVILDFHQLDSSSTYFPNYQYGMESMKYEAVFKDSANLGQLVTFDSNDLKVIYQPQFIGWINDWDGRENIAQPQDSGFVNLNDTFVYPNAYGEGINLTYKAFANYLKELIVIDNIDRLTPPSPTMLSGGNVQLYTNFILDFDNEGAVIINGEEWDYSKTYTQDDIFVQNHNGSVSYMIKKPYMIDAMGKKYNATYMIETSNNVYFLMIQIPYSDILNATFPITIDPTTGYNDTPIPVVELNLSEDIYNPLEKVSLYNVTGNGYIIIDTNITDSDVNYVIDPEELTFDYGEADVRNATGNLLLKCYDWDMETETCGVCIEYENSTCVDWNETWFFVDDLSVGVPYDFQFDAIDPAYAEYSTSDGESTTTGTTFVNKLSDTINIPETGNHLIMVTGQITGSSTGDSALVRAELDNTLTFMNSIHEPKDTTRTKDYLNFFGITMQNLSSGSHTIDVDYRSETGGVTTYIKNVRSNVFSLDAVEYNESLSDQTFTQETYATEHSLTFTPDEAGEYVIIATGELGDAGSNSYTIYSRMLVDGSEQGEIQFESQDATDYITLFFHETRNLSATEHTIALQFQRENTLGLPNRKNLRIVAIPMDEYWDLHYNESLAETSGSTPTNKTFLTFTPEYAGNYTFLASAEFYTSSGNDATLVEFLLDGDTKCEVIKELKELGQTTDGDWYGLSCMYQQNLAETPYTASIQFTNLDGTTSYLRNARITAFSTEDNEPDQCAYSGSGIWGFFVDIYCYIISNTTGDGSNIIISKTNTTEFNNVNISGFTNLTISNSSTMIVNNRTNLTLGG